MHSFFYQQFNVGNYHHKKQHFEQKAKKIKFLSKTMHAQEVIENDVKTTIPSQFPLPWLHHTVSLAVANVISNQNTFHTVRL